MKKYLDISPEIQEALDKGTPIVALETNLFVFGFPYPHNVTHVKEAMEAIRAEGAVPAIIAILDGKIKVGLTDEDLERLAQSKDAVKITRCDIAYFLASKRVGATTITATMFCASLAGIKFVASNSPGGVHRGWQKTLDISADLEEFANTPVTVICGGPKCILDIPATLEYLETKGVPVVGYGVKNLPAFMVRDSGVPVPISSNCIKEIADIIRIKWELGLKGGVVVANPVPEEFALTKEELEGAIVQANREVEERGIVGKIITPAVLDRLVEISEGKTLKASIALYKSCAKVGAQIAVEYFKSIK